jgi:hypothetical protein
MATRNNHIRLGGRGKEIDNPTLSSEFRGRNNDGIVVL